MKSPLVLSLAVVALTACTEATTPRDDFAASNAKSSDPVVSVSGGLTNNMYSFDDGTFSSSDGGSFTVESSAGGFGAAAPSLGSVYNNASNKFIGRLDNHRVNLIVPNGGSRYDISFDLYIIGSWDGNGKQSGKQYGVDIWQAAVSCTAGGPAVQTLIRTTFSNQKTVQQSYPHNYGEGGGTNKAAAGSFAVNALGFINDPTSHTPQFDSYGDTWYKMHFTGLNPCGAGAPLFLQWSVPGATLQSNYDESWGVDNVHIMTDA